MTPDPPDVEMLVGGDVSKGEHHATAVDAAGETLLSWTVGNDQAAFKGLLDAAAEYGTPALVIDQPGSIAALALAVARQRDVAVASRPGVVRRPGWCAAPPTCIPARPPPTRARPLRIGRHHPGARLADRLAGGQRRNVENSCGCGLKLLARRG